LFVVGELLQNVASGCVESVASREVVSW